jgi:hypothetical protein
LIDRYYQIEEHNKEFLNGKVPYDLKLNEFSHLSDEERTRQKTGVLPKPENYSDGSIPAVLDVKRGGRAVPVSFDWRSGEEKMQMNNFEVTENFFQSLAWFERFRTKELVDLAGHSLQLERLKVKWLF